MTKFFKTDGGAIRRIEAFEPGCWVDLVNPSDEESEQICALSGLPEALLKAALDEEERARVDTEDGAVLFIVDTPVLTDTDGEDRYSTIPLGILSNETCIVTVALRGSPILKDFMSRRTPIRTEQHVEFALNFMLENAKRFLFSLRQIDKMSSRIQEELEKSMKNRDLMRLLELQNSLVYFSTSLNSNMNVYLRINKMYSFCEGDENKDLYDDVITETKQAIETCTIYRDILTVTMDAFSSVISNSANNVMRRLTIVTVIIAIPTLIAGIWGMNMPVPFEGTKGIWAFWLVNGISLLVTVVAAILMTRLSSAGRVERAARKKRKK